MEVILLERVGRLGTVGDLVKVKNGYGRNFLLPQNKAVRATKESKAKFDAMRSEIEANNASTRKEAEKQAAKLGTITITLVRQASEDGKLYGSVTSRDIAAGLAELGHSIDRKQLQLAATIKSTGTYTAKVVLHPEVILTANINIVRNESDIPVEVPEELRAPAEEAAPQVETSVAE